MTKPATELTALLPCPFCLNLTPRNEALRSGLKVKRDPLAYLEPSTWIVLCLDCGANGANHNSESDAITAWNTRTPAVAGESDEVKASLSQTTRAILGPCDAGHEKHCSLLFVRVASALVTEFTRGRADAIAQCGEVARNFKGGWSATFEGDGNQLAPDPDGPWCLGSSVAEAILALSTRLRLSLTRCLATSGASTERSTTAPESTSEARFTRTR